jgi:hypothetical protein
MCMTASAYRRPLTQREEEMNTISAVADHRLCQHSPVCPSAGDFDRDAAHVLVSHPEQGWSLLCSPTARASLPDAASCFQPRRTASTDRIARPTSCPPARAAGLATSYPLAVRSAI